MVGQLWKSLARSNACAVKLVIRIIHLVTTEDSLQATLIECLIMGHEGKALYQWFYLFPYFWEHWSLFSILTSEAMHLSTPIIIVIWLWLDQRIESIYDFTITHNHYSNRANTGSLVVSCLEVYCCKVSHLSSLYLFHMCFEISATSSRNHLGSNTSISLPCERIS